MSSDVPDPRLFVSLQKRGLLAFPVYLREKYHLDDAGAQVEILEREEDGVIEIHPKKAIPADQAWFWSESWQAKEAEASADIKAGRVERFDDSDSFLDALDQVPE